MREPDLDKLFRAAAAVPNESSDEMPFGFDTRVLAHWRANRKTGGDVWVVAQLFRRLAVIAVVVAICAGSGAWWQWQQADESDSPASDAYAIADNAIEAGTWQ